jgi:hypothetical protein
MPFQGLCIGTSAAVRTVDFVLLRSEGLSFDEAMKGFEVRT